MSAVGAHRAEKPHLRKLNGYWRVSAVPVKWNRLCPRLQRRWAAAHEFVTKLNSQR